MSRHQTLTGVSLSLALFLTLPAAGQTPEELRDDVLALTGPGTEGRAVGTPGAATARRYLVSELEAAGARLDCMSITAATVLSDASRATAGKFSPR